MIDEGKAVIDGRRCATCKTKPVGENEKPVIDREQLLKRASSLYEAVVAISKEARRLNAVPGVFLEDGEKAVPKAVENFVEGKVEYEIEETEPKARPRTRRRKKTA